MNEPNTSNHQIFEQNSPSSNQSISQKVSLSEGVSDDVLDSIDPLTAALTNESLSVSIVAAIQMMESNAIPNSDNKLTYLDNITTPSHRKNIILSSDESGEPQIRTNKSCRQRVRQICSDSEDDVVTLPDKNSSYRQSKIVFDSDEVSNVNCYIY